MLITSLELRNVKSYEKLGKPITFEPGVNLVWGENGSGKTTLLEAIGYTLFGALDYKLAQFRREGQSSGEIVLTLVSNVDDRTYQVVNKLGGGAPYIYDPDTKRRLTRTKKDTEAWLADHIGVDPGKYAQILFSDAVGVSQGKMTGIFLEGSRPRKSVFDQLLRVEDYEITWKNLLKTDRYLREKLEQANEEVARLQGQLQRLPAVEKQIQVLEDEVAADADSLSNAQRRMTDLKAELSVLDADKANVGTLASQLEKADSKLRAIQSQAANAAEELRIAEEAARIVEKTAAGHATYREALARRQGLEAQRAERDRQLKALHETEKEIAEVEAKLSGIAAGLEQVVRAEARLVELAPLVERQEQLEAQVDKAEKQVAERQRALEAAEKAARRVDVLATSLKEVRAQLAERAKLESRLAKLADKRTALTDQLRQLSEQLTPLEGQRAALESALRAAQLEAQNWENAKTQLAEEQQRVEQRQAELLDVEAKLQEREAVLRVLETVAQDVSRRQVQQASARAEQAQCSKALEALDERLTMLRSAETAECPICKRQLDDHLSQELKAEFELEREKLLKLQRAARQAEAEADRQIKELQSEQREYQKRLEDLPGPGRAEELRQSIANQQEQVKKWSDQVEALSDATRQVEKQQDALNTLDQQLSDLRQQQTTAQQERDQLDAERDGLNAELVKLPQQSRTEELESEIHQAQEERGHYQDQAKVLADASKQLETAQAAQAELGDPRQEHTRQQTVVDRRPSFEQEQTDTRARQSKLVEKQQAQGSALSVFATLDADLRETDETLKKYAADDQQYTAHEKIAQTCNARKEALRQFQKQGSELLADRDSLSEQYTQAERAYDAERHQSVRDEVETTGETIVRLDTRVAELKKQLRSAQSELADLRQHQHALNAAEAEVTRLERLEEALKFVREGIRRAGPLVVQRRVKVISYQANRIFQDILEDPTLTLNWDETYAISVRCKGEERDFKQLSGGEQMAAAIAVRLALLMQMSQVRTIFLDEPTANLDDKRRDKLADRITRLEGLRQIFVITHDDAFQRETHHVVHVRKERGVSQAEVL